MFSPQEVAARRAALPKPTFPAELPISAQRDDVAAALREHQVVIVCGETGSGKTTQLPKICLDIGRGVNGLIGHTQPRRIAARATAARIAQELGSELGGAVGYKVRFTDKVGARCYVKLMTDGILLAETQGDRNLAAYDTIIIDEAHERSLNIDFLLGYLGQLLPRRPDLKLIVTSATLDAERFAAHFGGAPVIEVSGRLHPVELRYRAPPEDDEFDLNDAIVDAIDEAARLGPGDALVFLPGEREIREAAEALRKHAFGKGAAAHTEILPLYARLSAAEQERVFQPHTGRRVVLATNVAETSLTVPGIRFVIDSGLARVKRYSYRSKVEQLRTEPVSRAAATQRAGRCGRVAAGVCFRLYAEQDLERRPAYTDPEVLRSSLAAVILRMKALHLGEVEGFPFIDPPPPRAVADGYDLLAELGAVDDARELTALGRELARLPLDPRIGRMILAARDEASLREVLVIAAALSVQDPRDRPLARQGAADAAHARFDDEKSDFLAYLKLWGFFQDALRAKTSKRRLAQLCRDSFLSVARMREWVDIHRQLHTLAAEAGWHEADHPADYGQIHRALLAGLLGNVGCKSEDSEHYLGARGIKFLVHPGSGVGRKAGRWLMAAEIAQTTRLYARCVARIEPEWLERVGAHLVRRHAYDPHWEKKPAQVIAFERGTLYGLLLYANRRVPFRPPDAAESRRIFIQQALVGGDYETRAPFFQHNRKLIREIEQLEHKSRRPDVLVDDELIYAFYEQRVPAGIDNGAAFDAWRRQAEQGDPELLFLRRTELMRHEAAGITSAQFPPKLELDGHSYALDYRHEPGSARDGATLTVPLAALNQVSATACEWLVPGLLREKVRMLVKSLPQGLRRKLGPAPDFAARFSAAPAQTQVTVTEAIVRHARQELNLQIPLDAFRPETLPAHLAMNFRVVDEHGRELASGRDLAQLRVQLGVKAGERFSALARDEEAARRLTDWSFGDLDGPQEIRRGSETLVGFPALADHGDHVTLDLVDQPDEARRVHRLGLRRLFMLRLKEQARYLEKNLPGLRELALQFALIGDAASLAPQLLAAAFERTCMAEPWPATRAEFDARCDQARSRVVLIGQELARLVAAILAEHQAVLKRLAQSKAFADACRDVEQQLGHLLGPRFVEDTPFERLQHFPRYLKAAGLRLDKLRADAARDRRLAQELAPLQQGWLRERARRERRGVPDAQLDQFRWLLEELRVQLFAQELKTAVPVSVKRLTRFWQSLAP